MGLWLGMLKTNKSIAGFQKTQKKEEKKKKKKKKKTSLPLPNVFLNQGHRRGVLLLNRVQSQVLLHRQNSLNKKRCEFIVK
jgi:hypothetical protein